MEEGGKNHSSRSFIVPSELFPLDYTFFLLIGSLNRYELICTLVFPISIKYLPPTVSILYCDDHQIAVGS